MDIYPSEELFINSKNEQYSEYTDKGLQKMLSEISTDKNIGVNSYGLHIWLFVFQKTIIKKRKNSILMRSSVPTLEKHYLKNGDVGDEPENWN